MGLFSKIFGGSKATETSSSESYNKAFEPISTAFSPLLGYANQGAQNVSNFLSGDMSGFNNFRDNSGFSFLLDRGLEGVDSSMGARRLLQSGATLKGLENYSAGLNQTFADKYLQNQLSLAGLGTSAAQAMTGAGQYSTSQGESLSKSYTGIADFLGNIAAAAASSDRRLKKLIVKVGKAKSGLNLYKYHYIDGRGPFLGVMADEVEKIKPEAMGPEIGGYKTVNYALLGEEFNHGV